MKKFAIPALLLFSCTSLFAVQPQKGDSIFRFAYQYGSAENVPGTGGIVLPPLDPIPPPTPPTVCDEKPRPHDCPHAPIPEGSVVEPEQTHRSSFGVGVSYFLAEDFSLDFGASLPYGNAGTDTLSASAGIAYYLGEWAYVPLGVAYRGDLDSFAFMVGFGADIPAGERTVFRVAATEQILTANHLDDDLAWTIGGSIGWRLGGRK